MRACYSVVSKSTTIEMSVHKVYGILADGEEGSMRIDDITTSSEQVGALVRLLSENEVDFLHFRDVVDDYLLTV